MELSENGGMTDLELSSEWIGNQFGN